MSLKHTEPSLFFMFVLYSSRSQKRGDDHAQEGQPEGRCRQAIASVILHSAQRKNKGCKGEPEASCKGVKSSHLSYIVFHEP